MILRRFQKVFTEDDGQEVVFDTVARPVVDRWVNNNDSESYGVLANSNHVFVLFSVLEGYNGTMFAYGQVSC